MKEISVCKGVWLEALLCPGVAVECQGRFSLVSGTWADLRIMGRSYVGEERGVRKRPLNNVKWMWLKWSEWWVEWQQMRPEGGQRVKAYRQSWYAVCFFILRATELLSIHLDQAKSSASSPFLFLICLCQSPEPPPMMVAPSGVKEVLTGSGCTLRGGLCAYSGLVVQTTLWVSKGRQVESVLASWAHGLTHFHAHRAPRPLFSYPLYLSKEGWPACHCRH